MRDGINDAISSFKHRTTLILVDFILLVVHQTTSSPNKPSANILSYAVWNWCGNFQCIFYVQSSDRDSLWIVLRKTWIWALHRQSVDCSCACPCNIRCGHMYADWTTAIVRSWMLDKNNITFHKKCQGQCAKKEPGEGNQVLFALSLSSDGMWYTISISHYYLLMSAQFSINEISHLFIGSVWEDRLYSTLCILPWVQSKDWTPQAISTLSISSSMLCALCWVQSKDCAADPRIVTQSLDLRFAQEYPPTVPIHTLHTTSSTCTMYNQLNTRTSLALPSNYKS